MASSTLNAEAQTRSSTAAARKTLHDDALQRYRAQARAHSKSICLVYLLASLCLSLFAIVAAISNATPLKQPAILETHRHGLQQRGCRHPGTHQMSSEATYNGTAIIEEITHLHEMNLLLTANTTTYLTSTISLFAKHTPHPRLELLHSALYDVLSCLYNATWGTSAAALRYHISTAPTKQHGLTSSTALDLTANMPLCPRHQSQLMPWDLSEIGHISSIGRPAGQTTDTLCAATVLYTEISPFLSTYSSDIVAVIAAIDTALLAAQNSGITGTVEFEPFESLVARLEGLKKIVAKVSSAHTWFERLLGMCTSTEAHEMIN